MKRLVLGLFLLFLLTIGCQMNVASDPIVVQDIPKNTAKPSLSLNTAAPSPAETPVPTLQPTPAPTPSPSPSPSPTPEPTQEERLLAFIASMTLEEKIGQLCMFGFSGTKTVSSEFAGLMKTYNIGNVILYGQNIARGNKDGGFSQCRNLTASIRAANSSGIPLLISTDVEGGTVTRFKWKKSLESARTLGKKKNTDRARNEFLYIGTGLRESGINVDLAPVLDISKHPDDHFLGKRIISSDPDIASEIGIACIDGLHDADVLSIVKHFPGHGAANTDSHDKTPVVTKSFDTLCSYDLVPFQAAVRHGVDGVMVAHIRYELLDDRFIASQSQTIIQGLLRNEYGFSGIVISDDFRMAGLRNQSSLDQAAVRFLLAGGDLILCGANHSYQKTILKGLYDAVENGVLTEARIDESVFRILSAKLRVTDWSI